MKVVGSILILLMFFSCNSVTRLDNSAPSKEQERLTAEKIDKYKSARKRILYNAYKQYIEYSSLTNSDGIVTEDSVWDFKYQFENSAKVWNDIQLYEGKPQLLDAGAYADLIATYMKRKGLITKFEEPNINEFFAGAEEQYNPRIDESDEEDDIFYYTYSTVKKTFNILNKNNQVLYYDEPMIYPIEITFRISIKNQSADIVSILPSKDKKT